MQFSGLTTYTWALTFFSAAEMLSAQEMNHAKGSRRLPNKKDKLLNIQNWVLIFVSHTSKECRSLILLFPSLHIDCILCYSRLYQSSQVLSEPKGAHLSCFFPLLPCNFTVDHFGVAKLEYNQTGCPALSRWTFCSPPNKAEVWTFLKMLTLAGQKVAFGSSCCQLLKIYSHVYLSICPLPPPFPPCAPLKEATSLQLTAVPWVAQEQLLFFPGVKLKD